MFHFRGNSIFFIAFATAWTVCCFVQSVTSNPPPTSTPPNFTAALLYNPLYSITANPRSITLGDFNGDGRQDIATANYASLGGVSVLLANGGGGFGLATNYKTGSFPRFVLARDLNVDGKLDLAVVNSNQTPGISILLGDGLGGFGTASGFLARSSPESMAIEDLNHDGHLDLVVTNSMSNDISVLMGNGAGSFSTPTNIAVGTLPTSVAVGDFNGDMHPDLVVANSTSGNIQLLLNNGSGGFGVPQAISVGVNPNSVAVCDCNGDKLLDVVVANRGSNNVSVLLGTGSGNFSLPTNFPTNTAPVFVAPVDLNGDGKLDLAIANAGSHDVSILPGNGLGAFGSIINLSVGPIPQAIASDDFDLDGKADLAVAGVGGFVWIFSGKGDGNFIQPPSSATGSQPSGSVVDDFNRDGKLDLATANLGDNTVSILLGDGGGNFGTAASFPVGSNPHSVASADFNRDGKVDIVSANYSQTSPNTVSVLLGNGGGSLQSATTFEVPGPPLSLATGDFDGDGKPDIVIAAESGAFNVNKVTILLGNGNGGFSAPINVTSPDPSKALVAGDLNADGKTDIVASTGSRVSIIQGNASGTFAVNSSYQMTSNDGTNAQVNGVALGDLNSDGRLDLAVGIAGNFCTLVGNGDGSFQAPTNFNPGNGDFASLVGDFNGDGKNDVVLGALTGAVTVLTNESGSFERYDFGAGPSPSSLVAGDFNGDGKLDIAATDADKHRVFVLLNTTYQLPRVQLSASNFSIPEGAAHVDIVVSRTGDVSETALVEYATNDTSGASNCNVVIGVASSRCDYIATSGKLVFSAGETTKTISIPISDDSYSEGGESLTISLSNPTGAALASPAAATVTIIDNETANGPNPIDQAGFFVRQHYLDFLNREPDAAGLAHWSNQITECQQPGATCDAEVRRINVSAAFFVSIEFQETGYLVERLYKSAYGDATGTSTNGGTHQLPVPVIRLNEFLPGTQQIGQGVIVTQAGWEQVLENNKRAFIGEFVQRSRFTTAYPATLTPAEFVDGLFVKAGVTPTAAERASIINEFAGAGTSADLPARARALRRVAENTALVQAETNKAFVLMQYFGYLRRNPNDPQDSDYSGYDYWLSKLNQFNGNYIEAEMVKAFIGSIEYRQRFGP